MKYILTLALVWLGAPLTNAAEQPASAWCYGYLFASWNPGVALEPVIEGIAVEGAAGNQGSLDMAAEFLLQHLDDERFAKQDMHPLLALLGRTRSGRYRVVMEKVRASQRPVVLKDIAREYLLDSKATQTAQYAPGSVDFAALREQYISQALAAQPTDERARLLDALNKGDPIDKLFALLGPPQHVATGYVRVSETLNYRRLLLYYRGGGRAVFALDGKTGWRFQATVADPLAFELLMPYRARAADLGLPDVERIRMIQLMSTNWPAIRAAVEGAYREPKVPLEFLDATAELLSANWRNSQDELVEDSCAWMLRLLRAKGGARYAPLFDEIATKSSSLVLRKWARLKLLKYPGDTYSLGSISLLELARRYPSLYPDVNYANGRL